jgi:hypothetical protein
MDGHGMNVLLDSSFEASLTFFKQESPMRQTANLIIYSLPEKLDLETVI